MRHRCTTIALIFAACAILSKPACAQAPSLEQQLKNELSGKVLLLRGFPQDRTIDYDNTGTPQDKIKMGPWSLAGFQLDEVKLKPDRIELSGKRVNYYFNDLTRKMHTWKTLFPVHLRIHTVTASIGKTDLQRILGNIFIQSEQELITEVPDFWRPFLLKEVEFDAAGKPTIRDWPDTNQHYYTEKDGLAAPKAKYTPVLDLPPLAKVYHRSSRMVFYVAMDEEGKVQRLAIITPGGSGYDERAAEAISTWRFEPALLNGRPVPMKFALGLNVDLHYTSLR